jgi:FkbM family methyltransferase
MLTKPILLFLKKFKEITEFLTEKFIIFFDKMGIRRKNIFYRFFSFLRRNLYSKIFNNLYKRFISKGIVMINVQGNKMYVDTVIGGMPFTILTDGVMEKYSTELFKKIVKKGIIVVDIGANIGYYTLIAAGLVGENGIVYAFEPELTSYKLLCKNIEINGYTNVIPVQKAVSNKDGKDKLLVNKTNLLASSFSKKNALLFLENNSVAEENIFSLEVETVTLDGFFEQNTRSKKIDFMKIDVEGAEGRVIEGAKNILRNNDLKIIMEFRPRTLRNLGTDPMELIEKFYKYGFKKIEFINEKKQELEPITKIIKICKGQNFMNDLKDGFNLLIQK